MRPASRPPARPPSARRRSPGGPLARVLATALAGVLVGGSLATAGAAGAVATTGPVTAEPVAATATAATTTTATAATTTAAADAAYHFLDCAAPTDGDGSAAAPWSSLNSVAAHVFEPGDRLLLRRGAICHGTLTTQGSGTAEQPIVLDAYGDEADGYPVVAGGGVRDAVLLRNQEHWAVRNLEITNTDADPARRYTAARRGVTVLNVDAGELSGIRLEGLYIHDVYGEGVKDLGGSGAIQLEVDTADGVTRSWYDDTVISGNRIEDVNRSGINMSTAWKCRAEMAWDTPCDPRDPSARPFTPSTGLIIRDNTLTRVGGDGIVVQMNDGAIVESNVLTDGANRSNKENAGIWVWNSDNTLFQYNVVSNTQKISQNDGTAWDADYGSRNTVFQYNLSYDNAGGGMFFCGCGNWKIEGLGFATDVTYRYNLSVGDGQAADLAAVAGNANADRFQFLAGVTDSQSYNNTIILPATLPTSGSGHVLNGTNDTGSSLLLANNLFVTTGEIAPETYDSTVNVLTWLNNAFSGPAAAWPAGTGSAVVAETLLTGVQGTDAVQEFLSRSPALAAAGVPVAPAGTYDIQGTPVVEGCAPDIGAFQLTDQGAQPCASAWDDRTVAAGSSIVVPVRANATLRVTGTVEPGGTLTVTGPGGLAHVATADPGAGTVSTVVRTSTDAAPELTIACTGGGCQGVQVTGTTDEMIDGSFETLKNSPWYLSPWTSWVSPWSGTAQQRARQAAELRTERVTGAGRLAARLTAAEPRLAQDDLPVDGGADYRLTAWALPAEGAGPMTVTVHPFVDNVVGSQVLATFTVDDPAEDDALVHLDERFTLPDGVTAVTVLIAQPGLTGTQEALLDDLTLTPAVTAPTVTRQPADVTATEGDLATFLADFAGNEEPAVEWQRLVDGTWQPVTATRLGQEGQVARTDRLVLDAVTTADSGSTFRAVGTSSAGTVTTREVTLTVEPRGSAPSATVTAPRYAVVGTDETATVQVTGSPEPTVRWQRSADGTTWSDVEGTTGAAPALALDGLGAPGETVHLRVVAANAFGEQASAAVPVTVLATPGVTVPVGEVVAGGTVEVAGTGARPGERVDVELHSEPVLLATVTADATGAFRATVTIPAATPAPARHHLVAVGAQSGELARVALAVAAVPQDGTGTDAGTGGTGGGTDASAPGGGTGSGTAASAGTGRSALAVTGLTAGSLLLLALGCVGVGVVARRIGSRSAHRA
jgi:hypothetical protein